MKRIIIIFVIFLTACSSAEGSDKTHLTIKPVELSDREKQLISKAGADDYQFFELDGYLAEEDDLIISAPIYKNGEKVSKGMSSSGMIKNEFQNSLYSISLNHYGKTIIMGSPNGEFKGKYRPNEDYTISGFRNNLKEETTLKKGETLYLAHWFNQKENSIRTAVSEPTKLSRHVKNSDYAIVYTIKLVEDEKEKPGD